jgi:hypothetical protein
MNAMQSFFKKYHAVPADDRGIDWQHADEAVLLEWFGRVCDSVKCGWNREAGRQATAAEVEGQRPMYLACVAEVCRGVRQAVRERSRVSGRLFGAYLRSRPRSFWDRVAGGDGADEPVVR